MHVVVGGHLLPAVNIIDRTLEILASIYWKQKILIFKRSKVPFHRHNTSFKHINTLEVCLSVLHDTIHMALKNFCWSYPLYFICLHCRDAYSQICVSQNGDFTTWSCPSATEALHAQINHVHACKIVLPRFISSKELMPNDCKSYKQALHK